MKAELNNYRQSPRKVRLVADLIRGKKVEQAVALLKHLPKRASAPILKLLKSAVANAEEKENLFVKSIQVNQGAILKRSRPRAHGRAFPIHKHTSLVSLELGAKTTKLSSKAK